MNSAPEQEHALPRNILLVTGSLTGGGAERVLSDMANYWARKGWTVSFATWSGPDIGDFYKLDPKVRRVYVDVTTPRMSLVARLTSNLRRVLEFRKTLLDLQPDAVLSFINTSNIRTILATAGLRTRVVVSERVQPSADSTASIGCRILRILSYAWSDEIVVQSRDTAEWMRKYCRKPAVIIPNPLRSLPQLTCEREPLIVAVGRLEHQKGFDLLLRAFAKVAKEFDDWNVSILGEGSEYENLLVLRNDLGLTERVQFTGHVRDVEVWMARAGLVVQPSRFEGFPNVLLESMAAGATTISADCPSGPADIIEDGIDGRLVPVEDVEALAGVMQELMSRPELRTRLGNAARKVRQKYRQDKIMRLWEQCIFPEHKFVRDSSLHVGEDSLERGQPN